MMTTTEILQLGREIVSAWDWVTEISQPEPNRLDAKLTRLADLVPIIVGLRVKRLGYLSAITGIDPGAETGELEVLYHFCTGNAVISLRVSIPREDAKVPTISEIIPIAEAYERELSEMFGITVEGLRNTAHLYLPDDWPASVYPLRKDFDPVRIDQIVNKEYL